MLLNQSAEKGIKLFCLSLFFLIRGFADIVFIFNRSTKDRKIRAKEQWLPHLLG